MRARARTIRDGMRVEIQKKTRGRFTSIAKTFQQLKSSERNLFPAHRKSFREEVFPKILNTSCFRRVALIADAVSVFKRRWVLAIQRFHGGGDGTTGRLEKLTNASTLCPPPVQPHASSKRIIHSSIIGCMRCRPIRWGAGGAMRSVSDSQSGTRHMEITCKTYWYVKKYISHTRLPLKMP